MSEPTITFASPAEWETWLAEHHADSTGILLKLAKKGSGTPSVSYAEALDVALCFGWIDARKQAFDEVWWLQRFTPRTARSRWSKINRTRAQQLLEQGLVREPGRRAIEAARADGRWAEAYEGQATAAAPPDLQAALDASERASAFFATLDRVNRYAIVHRIGAPGTPETRARRIARYVAMLEAGERIHEPRPR